MLIWAFKPLHSVNSMQWMSGIGEISILQFDFNHIFLHIFTLDSANFVLITSLTLSTGSVLTLFLNQTLSCSRPCQIIASVPSINCHPDFRDIAAIAVFG